MARCYRGRARARECGRLNDGSQQERKRRLRAVVMTRGSIQARSETARLALSCRWTSSLLPTKCPNHLDAVADNLDLPTEPATALLCARPWQD